MYLLRRPLLHRENELDVIAECLRDVAAGRPAVVIVEGTRGMGKTHLLQAIHARTGSDVLVLRARGHHAETSYPLGVVRQLFDPVIDSGRFAGAAHVVERLADPGQGAGPDFLYGLYRATRTLASARPLLITVDDFPHADEQSAQWLAYLARRMDGLAVGMVLAGNPADPGTEGLATELHALPYTRRLALTPLCASCGETSVATTFGTPVDAAFAAACHQLAGGNPQILQELCDRLKQAGVLPDQAGIAAVAEQGPAVLWETVEPWLRRRRPDSVELLEFLAVLGPDADLETASMMSGEEHPVPDLAAELRALGLLDKSAGRLAYPRLREAVLDRMKPEHRAALHGRAAALLFRLGSAPELAAEHMMAAGAEGPSIGGEVLRRAAREAVTRQEWDAAARYLRRALAEHADDATAGRTVAQLGAVEMHRDVPTGIRYFRAVCERDGPPAERFSALEPLADLILTLESASVGRFHAHALNTLPPAAARGLPPGPALRVAAQALMSGHSVDLRPVMRRAKTRPGARNRHALSAPGAAEDFSAALAITLAARGRHRAAAVRHARNSLDSAIGTAGHSTSAWAAILALGMADELQEAAALARAQLAHSRLHRSPAETALALVGTAEIDFRRGDLEASHAAATEAVEQASSVGAHALRMLAGCCVARVLIERGTHDGVEAALRGPDRHDIGHPLAHALHLETRGRYELGCGRLREGLRLLLEAGQHLYAHGMVNPAWIPWQSRAIHAYLAAREHQPARLLAEQQLAAARAWGAPSAVGRALTVAAAVVQPSARLPMLREATAILADSSAALERARALTALGAALVDAGKDREARDVLRTAVEAAERCGAARLKARALDKLSAAGGRPRELSDRQRAALTWAELRVVRLVVRGMSNMQAAETLSISKRTVDTHLARTYRKLGISNRSQLVVALRTSGDDI